MSDLIENIKVEHERLTLRQQETDDPFDLITEIQAFIQQIRTAGKDTPPGAERELLRSLVQYWASIYFDSSDTGVFPKTELDPFTGEIPPDPPSEPDTHPALRDLLERYERQIRYLVFGGGILGVFLVIIFIRQIFVSPPSDVSGTMLPALDQTGTASYINLQLEAIQATSDRISAEQTRSAMGDIQTATSNVATAMAATETPTPEPTPTNTPTPSPTPTLAPEILLVELTNLKDQDTVAPQMMLNGTYTNLRPGWSIHALIQNIAQEGAPFFPAEAFFLIPDGEGNGAWTIPVQFGIEDEWGISTPYRVTLRIATTDADRELLDELVDTGIPNPADLPPTIQLPSNLVPVTVIRNAFENRIVYTRLSDQGVDLFSSTLDGLNEIPLTQGNSTTEVDPSLSSDGLRIVFVGVKTNHPDYNYSLWIIDSTGQNQVELEGTRTFNPIERPAWSPDGSMIVFNERNLATGVWSVKLLTLSDLQIHTLSQDGRNFRSPVWMPNGKFLVVSARALNPLTDNLTLATLGLFKMDVETGATTELYTSPDLAIEQPAISPDGRYLAFVAYPANNPEASQSLYVLEIDSETGLPNDPEITLQPLTTRSFLTYPVWDSESETIYFQTLDLDTASGNFVGKIFAIDRSGENIRLIPTEIRIYRGPVIGLIEITNR